MPTAEQLAKTQHRFDELCAASIRAITGAGDLHFRGRRLHRGERALPLFAPHLHPEVEHDDFNSFRGAADGLALRLCLSTPALQARHAPTEAVARALFELFEQCRVEAAGAQRWPGMRLNLQHRFEAWTTAFLQGPAIESTRGLSLFAVAQMAHSRITGLPMPEAAEDPIEAIRAQWLAPQFGAGFQTLRRLRLDEPAFAAAAAGLATELAARMAQEAEQEPEPEALRLLADERFFFNAAPDLERQAEDEASAAGLRGRARQWDEAVERYRVFTRAHDREFKPADQLRREQLEGYRQRLDETMATSGLNLPRWVRELKAALARPQTDGWQGGEEEGRIDARRLSQLVASPHERRLFRRERVEPVADAAVTLLIDCSGSMRAHLQAISLLADLLARALELAGARCEVLGFSTGAWAGGRAATDWRRAGSPANPGRLNELALMVFKDASLPWRRGRTALSALLREDLYREGIDGEAVAWAAQRLLQLDEPAKHLLVLSDGCPMERATAQANGEHYLDAHLRGVVARLERSGGVQVAGVGIGLDLSPYYQRALQLDFSGGLTQRMLLQLALLLAGRTPDT